MRASSRPSHYSQPSFQHDSPTPFCVRVYLTLITRCSSLSRCYSGSSSRGSSGSLSPESAGPAPLEDLTLNGDDTNAAAPPTLAELLQSRPPLHPALDEHLINITFHEVVEQPKSKPICSETAGPPVDMDFVLKQVRLGAEPQVHIYRPHRPRSSC